MMQGAAKVSVHPLEEESPRLSTDDLRVLGEILDAAIARGDHESGTMDLYAFADARVREALRALELAMTVRE